MKMTNAEVAAAWVKGLTSDFSTLAALSHPEMRVWHSHDDMWLSRAESEARMAESAAAATPSDDESSGTPAAMPVFEITRSIVTDTGFVVQGSIAGLGGNPGRTHIVQICTVDNGLIASCEEFIAPEMKLG
jgi:ketosteroid isomerase-like protein